MPVYACFRGDCDNLAHEQPGSQVFITSDTEGRHWLCVDTGLAEIPPFHDLAFDVARVQQLAHRHGFSFEGTEARWFVLPDQIQLRKKLARPPRPPSNDPLEQIVSAGWSARCDNFFARPVRVVANRGRLLIGAEGENRDEAWHRLALRVLRASQPPENGGPALNINAEPVPLYPDADGAIRVGESRVTIETVVRAFQEGSGAEDIVSAYPTLDLADVYTVIGYYLRHKEDINAYIEEREKEADELEKEIRDAQPVDDGLRAKLLARREKLRADNAAAHQ